MGLKSNPDLYVWDTAVFLALLRDDEPKRSAMIEPVLAEIQAGRVQLGFSRMVDVEFLDLGAGDNAFSEYKRFSLRSDVLPVDVQVSVTTLAGEIRSHLKQAKDAGEPVRILKAADAVHLASARLVSAKMLHTFDKDLLTLNGHSVASGVTITEPRLLNPTLPLLDAIEERSDADS